MDNRLQRTIDGVPRSPLCVVCKTADDYHSMLSHLSTMRIKTKVAEGCLDESGRFLPDPELTEEELNKLPVFMVVGTELYVLVDPSKECEILDWEEFYESHLRAKSVFGGD